ncbi:hypothetical protein C8R43DRAFT_1195568 [Mycena crocata]|nr:hypothetical protein C8R43DRAFT_959334 [Mycena crocata]KAJ7147706.1 hypothetical protein C8R43DRAFT_1195568 [Mycena crocata]
MCIPCFPARTVKLTVRRVAVWHGGGLGPLVDLYWQLPKGHASTWVGSSLSDIRWTTSCYDRARTFVLDLTQIPHKKSVATTDTIQKGGRQKLAFPDVAGTYESTLHRHTRQQRYTKVADWTRTSSSVWTAYAHARRECWDCVEQSGVDGAMVARRALIKPWMLIGIGEHREWDISACERLEGIQITYHAQSVDKISLTYEVGSMIGRSGKGGDPPAKERSAWDQRSLKE